MTQSQISICQAAANSSGLSVRFIVFGTEGGQNYAPVGADVIQGSRISLKQIITGRSLFLTEIATCNVVLDIGEGDSFADIYGFKRLLFLFTTKICVLLQRTPLVVSPQTIGPFEYWFNRKLAAAIMRRCTRVFARDYQSAAYLREIGVKGNISETIDVAFRLPYTGAEPRSDGKCHIGINVSGLLFSGGYQGGNQFGITLDYPTLIRQLISKWSNDPNNIVWLIAHVIPDALPRDDDRIAITTLAKEFPTVKLTKPFSSPEEAKSFISGMDFVTGARMHACIAALSTGVAVMPVAYSRKFNGLFTSLKYPHFVDGKRDSTAHAFQAICNALDNRTELKQLAVNAQVQAIASLKEYENFLARLFRKLKSQ